MAYNASSTYKSFLMHSTDGTTYTKLIDIKDYPDLGGDPETIDTTTLTDIMRTSVPGIQDVDNLTFTANYDPDQFATLQSVVATDSETPSYYAVWFGGTEVAGSDPTPTGNLGKFSFKGRMNAYVSGNGVNEARSVNISIALASKIEWDRGTSE